MLAAKMSIQEKIADLDRRVQALESRPAYNITDSDFLISSIEWRDFWNSFDLLMKRIFKH